MFRTIGDQPSLWESLLPDEVLQLPEELARVDALLDDPVFSAAFACCFDPLIGRPRTPVECYLRLMFLAPRKLVSSANVQQLEQKADPAVSPRCSTGCPCPCYGRLRTSSLARSSR
jgi:hypothetical protein